MADFSSHFFLDFCPHPPTFDFSGNTVGFSDQPAKISKDELIARIEDVLKEIRRENSLAFVRRQLAELEASGIREIVPLIFIDNFERLIQTTFQARVASVDEINQKKELLEEVAHDFCEQVHIKGPVGRLERRHFCQLVPPDVTFKIGKKELKAHQGLLRYYSQWASEFRSDGLEKGPRTLKIKTLDPDAFERVLDWCYSHELRWLVVPTADDNKETIQNVVIDNLGMLKKINEIARQYRLQSLFNKCKESMTDLHSLGYRLACLSRSELDFSIFQKKVPLASFSDPSSTRFRDSRFQINGQVLLGNLPLLVARSSFFRRLFRENPESLLSNNYPNIHIEFFEKWIEDIEKGHFATPQLGLSLEQKSKWGKWSRKENPLQLLKLAHEERDVVNKTRIAYEVVSKSKGQPLPEEVTDLFGHLELDLQFVEKFPRASFKIRSLTIDQIEKITEFKYLLKNRGEHIRELNFEMVPWVNDEILSLVAQYCPNLQRLYFKNCKNFTDEAIIEISKNCPELEVLRFSSCKVGDAAILEVVYKCKFLRELVLKKCEGITEKTIQNIKYKVKVWEVS